MRNTLFVWIPRTAGSSIWARFCKSGSKHAWLTSPAQPPGGAQVVTYRHEHIPSLVERGIITPGWLADRYVFSFVRNPWDRLVSIYHHLRQGNPDQQAAVPMGFAEYIERVCSGDVPALGGRGIDALSYANPQTAWLDLGNGRQPDFIGRFENLAEDWTQLCDVISCRDCRAIGGRSNRSRHKPYATCYTQRLRDLVAERYTAEVERFGYEFE